MDKPKMKSKLTKEDKQLIISIPTRKNVALLIFLTIFLGFWFNFDIKDPDLIATILGLILLLILIWNLFGRQVITINDTQIKVKNEILNIGYSNAYSFGLIKDIAMADIDYNYANFFSRNLDSLGFEEGRIAFDYGTTTVTIAPFIDEAEALCLLQIISDKIVH